MRLTISVLIFVAGALFGSICNQPTLNSVNKWLDVQTPEQQYDFLDARLTPEIRRAIAENWCLQNQNTVRVCHNATKYSRPIK
jgi:hypothetical protein